MSENKMMRDNKCFWCGKPVNGLGLSIGVEIFHMDCAAHLVRRSII